MKKLSLSLAAAAIMAVSGGQAQAAACALTPAALDGTYRDFCVREASVPGTAGGFDDITADLITGGYSEKFVVTGPGTFFTSAYWNAGQLRKDEGAVNITDKYLGASNAFGGYGMYGLFSATGTYVTSGGNTTFTGATATISLYIDPMVDNTFSFDGFNNAVAADPSNDDYLIASSSTLLSGEGNVTTGQANGNFDLLFDDLVLTAAGLGYFIAPSPFHVQVDISGQFISFVPGGVSDLAGSADVFFVVPEPGALALTSLALLALGGIARRRSAT